MSQGINISSSTAPGTTSVGGILTIKSLKQVQEDDRQAAEAANLSPVVQGLAYYIRMCWTTARVAKEQTIEPRLLKCIRQRRGEYDPEIKAQIAAQGGSEIYMMLAANKCRAAASWIKDVMLSSEDGWPFAIEPTPIPDVSPVVQQQILAQATQAVTQLHMQGLDPSVEEVSQLMINMRDKARMAMKEYADQAAERMELKMKDQLVEGGWEDAFSEFIDDVVTFPSAFLKGPVVRRRPRLKWVGGQNGNYELQVQDDLLLEWERVDPFYIYPAPDAAKIDDSFLIERHRLHRADLNALIGVEGYSDSAIRAVLDEYGRGGLREWLMVDTAKAQAEGHATSAVATNPSELIDALQFWGSVQGRMLIEWGFGSKEIDPMLDYPIEAWLIGHWVIKASINPDPMGRKPYFKASYEEVPGAFWGNSVNDLCRDSADMCNTLARGLANNTAIASGPQVVYNVDRLPSGEDVTQLYPWKVWQVTSDPLAGTQAPMQFFQPTAMTQELMAVYEKFSILADEYTGIPRYMTGASPTGGAGRTASGMSMLMSNAGKSIKQVISNIDKNVIKKALDRLYFYNMKYATDPDLKGDVNIVARGATSLMVKEQAQQRRNEFIQMTLASPAAQQIIGMEGLASMMRENAKSLGMDTNEVVPPLEILKERWAQQAMAQQAALMSQAQPGQGGSPPRLGKGQQLMDGEPVANNFPPQAQ